MENEFNRMKLEALEVINDSNHNESIDYIYQGKLNKKVEMNFMLSLFVKVLS